MGRTVGRADLLVVPKFDGLSKAVESEFAKVKSESLGERTGSKYTKGMSTSLMKSGAIVGAFAAITNKAIGSISSHLGDAVSRFDTLNNYPKVMQTLGYSSEDAESSISTLSDRLQTLPTTLDSMVSTTQRLVTTTGDLKRATDGSLALNDMLLAGGANQQVVNSAMEQFQQILAKGKPEMQDWRSIITAAPGQMDQLAKAMLGPTAKANDLYAALGGGKNDPIISMDELLDKIIELDQVGGEGITSFKEQAETASGGVATSLANMGNAVTRGITSVMDTIGKENIAGAINDMKGGINDAFKGVNSIVADAMPLIEQGYDALKDVGPTLLTVAGGFAAVKVAGLGLRALPGIISGIASPLNLVAAGVAVVGTMLWDSYQKQEKLTKATSGLSDAVDRASGLDKYAGRISGIGDAAGISAKSVDELIESSASLADKMAERNSEAESEIGLLNDAKQAIENSIGATEQSAEANGHLEWALGKVNDQFGLALTKEDVINGFYQDQEGNVRDLKQSIDELIDAKKREIEMSVLSKDYEDAYSQWREAEKTVGSEYAKVDWDQVAAIKSRIETLESNGARNDAWGQAEIRDLEASLWDLTGAYERAVELRDLAKDATGRISAEMGQEERAIQGSADQWDSWATVVQDSVKTVANSTGGFSNLVGDLRELGVDTNALATLEEGQLLAIAKAYDGTKLSVVEALQGIDGALSETVIKTYDSAMSMADALNGIGAGSTLEEFGLSVSDLAYKMADAGVAADSMEGISSEAFSDMANACGGNIDQMISAITMYNEQPIVSKDGSITVDETTLVDALGNIYAWNGQALTNLDGSAVVDTVQLMDAQGSVVEWNGSELKTLSSTAKVEHSSVWDAVAAIRQLNKQKLEDHTATYTVNYVTSGTQPHAAGAFLGGASRLHASGAFITNGTTYLGTDRQGVHHIAGEAGREFVQPFADGTLSIIPVENRKYMAPFASVVADMIGGAGGTVYNVTIHASGDADGYKLASDFKKGLKMQNMMKGGGR